MIMLVFFLGKYCFYGRMEMEVGDLRRLLRIVVFKLLFLIVEFVKERKF